MRRLALLICLVLSFAGTTAAFKNEPSGFRGMKWGTPLKSIKGLAKTSTRLHGTVCHKFKDADRLFGIVPIQGRFYCFSDEKLVLVYTIFGGHAPWVYVLRTVVNWFETPSRMGILKRKYIWIGKKSVVYLERGPTWAVNVLLMGSAPLLAKAKLLSKLKSGTNSLPRKKVGVKPPVGKPGASVGPLGIPFWVRMLRTFRVAIKPGYDDNGKPGRIVVDRDGYRYVQWPFTFDGLTVGKPISSRSDFFKLFSLARVRLPKLKIIWDKLIGENLKLNRKGISEHGIHAAFIATGGAGLGYLAILSSRSRSLADEFVAFMRRKIPSFPDLEFNFFGMTRWGLLSHVEVGVRDAGSGNRPLALQITPALFKSVFGKPDYEKAEYEKNKKRPYERIVCWKNLCVVASPKKVCSIVISLLPSYRVYKLLPGPKPLGLGWLLPWRIARSLAPFSHKVEAKIKIAAEKGLYWSRHNDYRLIREIQNWGPIRYPYSAGASGSSCVKLTDPFWPYLFPGGKIPETDFSYCNCILHLAYPAILSRLGIFFNKKTRITIAAFVNFHGLPEVRKPT